MLKLGDSLDLLKEIPDNSFHAIITDPPYGLNEVTTRRVNDCLKAWVKGEDYHPKGSGFMDKDWDSWVPSPTLWREVYRVLKPGGWALVFSATRNQDLMGISMRLAGFEIKDNMQWLHKGFPKNTETGKLVDKALGVDHLREVIGKQKLTGTARKLKGSSSYGAALANIEREYEDTYLEITKPYSDLAKKWHGFGTGLKPMAEPIIMAQKPIEGLFLDNLQTNGCGPLNIGACRIETTDTLVQERYLEGEHPNANSRHPSNVVIDEYAGALLDQQVEKLSGTVYVAKPSKKEKSEGLADLKCMHPTIKPIALMRYLIRLATPPGGVILDPFVGSGTTLCAAALEGVEAWGFERDPDYFAQAQKRVEAYSLVGDKGAGSLDGQERE